MNKNFINNSDRSNSGAKFSVSLVSILLVLALLAGVLPQTGCANTKSKMVSEGVLSPENLELSGNGVSMKLNALAIDTELEAKITEVDGAPPLDKDSGIELTVYDFTIEGVSELAGVIDLIIPLKLTQGALPGAAYLNEITGEWEPVVFRYDSGAETVIISTDHLSKYGVFSASGEGLRKARVEFLMLGGNSSADENFMSAIKEYTALGVPASECIAIGVNSVGDSLQLGGDILGGIAQSAGYLAYADDVMSTVGDYLGNIGLITSVVQIGLNASEGKIHDGLVGSMKFAWSYTMGKITSKLSSSVMSASMASVAIVDYSINKFGTEAIEGRASIYRDAYNIYYQKNERGYKSSAYWYQTLYPLFKAGNLSEEELKAEIDRIITSHCNEFWGGSNVDGVDAYVDMAREKFTWTGGGAGLNDTIRNNISSERRSILYNDVIPGVIHQIARKINLENERKLRAEYRALSDYLNTSISFSLTDTNKTYAGYTLKFAPLNDKADPKNWTGKISGGGTVNSSFTLYGHMYAGSPNTIEIYEPGSDVPVKTVSFKVALPGIEIVLDDEAPDSSREEESGFDESPADPTAPQNEQEYSWVLVDTVIYDGQDAIDIKNKGYVGVYDTRGKASSGNYSVSWNYVGKTDTYYEPDLIQGEGDGSQAIFSIPPDTIKAGEAVSLSLSLSFTENTLSFFDGNASASADFDKWDVSPGSVTRNSIEFSNKDGKSFFAIYSSVKYSEKNILSVSETITAIAPSGSVEGDRIAIRTKYYAGISMGTNYVYEWQKLN